MNIDLLKKQGLNIVKGMHRYTFSFETQKPSKREMSLQTACVSVGT